MSSRKATAALIRQAARMWAAGDARSFSGGTHANHNNFNSCRAMYQLVDWSVFQYRFAPPATEQPEPYTGAIVCHVYRPGAVAVPCHVYIPQPRCERCLYGAFFIYVSRFEAIVSIASPRFHYVNSKSRCICSIVGVVDI